VILRIIHRLDSRTNTVIDTISLPFGSAPQFIAFNPNNGNMYVTNRGSNDVSVIAPITTTFSSGCNGTIDSGQAATCDITNTFGK
jgi:DNA-binding beta-propeller fold protein YncE